MILALQGGNSKTLVYFRLMKELYKKNIYPQIMAGASGGAIAAACIACIRVPEKIKDLYLKIQGDRIMKWSCELQTGKLSLWGKIWRMTAFLILKNIPFNSMRNLLRKNLTWKKAKLSGTKFMAFVVVKQKDVIRTFGKEILLKIKKDGFSSFLGFENIDNFKQPSRNLIKSLPVYFFSNDGVFRADMLKITRISHRVVPLWKAVMASFSNPLLPSIYLPFEKGKKEKCFDGGIANNYANMILTNYPNFKQISCGAIPGKSDDKEKGISGINKIYYNLFRALPKNEIEIKTKVKYKGFFAFNNANIKQHFEEKETNIF